VLAYNLNSFEDSLANVIQRGIEKQEICSQPDARERAQFLAMGLYGLRTYAATRKEAKILKQLGNTLIISVLS
jgi:hypothetical protein